MIRSSPESIVPSTTDHRITLTLGEATFIGEEMYRDSRAIP